MNRTRIIAGIALGLIVTVGAQAEEKKIKQSNLPAAVQKTAADNTAGATVTGYTSDKVDGAMVYQMNLKSDGRSRSVVMDSQGAIVSVEQEVAWADLPEKIQQNFTGVQGKGKFEAVSTITKDGQIVAYEGVLIKNGERNHVRVKPTAPAADAAPAPAASN
jgi:hypothetical protein